MLPRVIVASSCILVYPSVYHMYIICISHQDEKRTKQLRTRDRRGIYDGYETYYCFKLLMRKERSRGERVWNVEQRPRVCVDRPEPVDAPLHPTPSSNVPCQFPFSTYLASPTSILILSFPFDRPNRRYNTLLIPNAIHRHSAQSRSASRTK